ncbi:MAG: class I SAM-dependent methyltransferase [Acidobacteria bacterium]|nr:MAG: class I SAM-dependent methyltransferase [Acidobacteriota bacterium]
MLSHQQARAFYDRFGARQDRQGFYEDAALAELIAHGAWEQAASVVELGCGTGRLAERLLAQHLPAAARYLGVDLSSTMVELARRRLARFGERAAVRRLDGTPEIDLPAASCDRFLSTYVLDLLPLDEVEKVLSEAHRLLVPGGLLALAGLSPGTTLASRLVSRLWSAVHALRPSLVGGCRPLAVRPLLGGDRWRIIHHRVVTPWGIPSEVLIAARRG